MPPRHTTAAIVLAGGTSQRMGSDKLDLTIGGHTLLERAIGSASTIAELIMVAGPQRDLPSPPDTQLTFVPEDPPLGGPVAGIAAALSRLPADITDVLVLAGDLAHPAEVVALLDRPISPDRDGVALVDDEGFTQYLAARCRRASLDAAIESVGQVRDRGVRSTLKSLRLTLIPAPTSTVADLDTPEQAAAAGASTPPQSRPTTHPDTEPDTPQNYTT